MSEPRVLWEGDVPWKAGVSDHRRIVLDADGDPEVVDVAGYRVPGDRTAAHLARTLAERDAELAAARAELAALREVAGEVLIEVARATAKFPTWPTDPLHARRSDGGSRRAVPYTGGLRAPRWRGWRCGGER